MASTTVFRFLDDGADMRISLTASNFCRPFAFADGWTSMRIAMRLIMTNTGADLTSTPRFWVGLCSGNTNMAMDATTTHFFGCYTSTATWAYTAAAPTRYGAISVLAVQRIGATITNSGGNSMSTSLQMRADATTSTRQFFCVDITKAFTPTTYSCGGGLYCNSTSSNDVTTSNFLATIPLSTMSFTYHTPFTARFLTVSEETYGTLDHVNIGWDRASPTIEISDLALVKLS